MDKTIFIILLGLTVVGIILWIYAMVQRFIERKEWKRAMQISENYNRRYPNESK